MAELTPLPMYQAMLEYVADNGGRWAWGRCDCIGLLMHLCERATGRRFDRGDYIDTRMDYRQSIVWLSGEQDQMRHFTDLIERDAGFAPAKYWDVAIIKTSEPLLLADRRSIYPTDAAPGVIFNPEGMEPCVMNRNGFAPVVIPWDEVTRSKHYRLFD